jgi:hypothetical protein
LVFPVNNIFRQITSHVRHIHFHSVHCLSYLLKNILPFYTFEHLRYVDITDNDSYGLILSEILQQNNICRNIFHLNISGLHILTVHDIKEISKKCSQLQTLKFFMNIYSSFKERLDIISQFLLIDMRYHLHYLHIDFKPEKLLTTSMTPSETQLSEWLGYNQNKLSHIQAIELNRRELSAWM